MAERRGPAGLATDVQTRAATNRARLRPRRQHQRLLQSDNLFRAVRVGDGNADDATILFVDDDLLWVANQMVIPVERNIDQVVFRVVGHSDHRNPLGRDLIAEIERGLNPG